MIDIAGYNEKNEKGLMTMVRITEDTFALSTKKYDATDGTELPEEVVGGNIIELLDKKAELQAEIAEIDSFIKEFKALVAQN